MNCEDCRLCWERQHNIVGMKGKDTADIMFVGEAPGREEDEWGVPFVGQAGSILTTVIGSVGLTWENSCVVNAVRCRPANNRTPMWDEIVTCRKYLFRDIAEVNPILIVALGRVALSALYGKDANLDRGEVYICMIEGISRQLIYTYHPAWVLYGKDEYEKDKRKAAIVHHLKKNKTIIESILEPGGSCGPRQDYSDSDVPF